jgi:hypothetical protein
MTGKRRKLFWTSGRDAAARNEELKGSRSCRRIEMKNWVVDSAMCTATDLYFSSFVYQSK